MAPSEAVCTLFEKHHHHGVAALVNSLAKAGFSGKVFCGYRGSLPPWAKNWTSDSGNAILRVNDFIEIVFIPCSTDVHFTNYKPSFMIDLLEGLASEVAQLHYFDPDIVLGCKWDMIRRWATGGIALSEDFNGHLPTNHPLKLEWKAWISQFPDLSVKSAHDSYYSAGYVGVAKENLGFLKTWADVIEKVSKGQNLQQYCLRSSKEMFYVPDQDAMNVALMCGKFMVNGAGPDAMAFGPWGRFPKLLFHAVGFQKPWLGGYLRLAMRGHAPTHSARMFLKNTDGPIKSLSTLQRFLLKLDFRLAVQISRVFKPTECSFRNP